MSNDLEAADSGAPALVQDSASEDGSSSMAGGMGESSSARREIVNDFIIPTSKEEDKEKHAGRQF